MIRTLFVTCLVSIALGGILASCGGDTPATPDTNTNSPATLYQVRVGTLVNGNGSVVAADPTNAVAGTTVTLTVTAASNRVLRAGSLQVNEGVVALAGGGPFTFTMPADHAYVGAEFYTTYALIYHGNGHTAGSVPAAARYTNQHPVDLPGQGNLECDRDGIRWRFIGWSTVSNASPVATPYIMPGANSVLFAAWTPLGGIGPSGGLVFYDHGAPTGSPAWRYMEAAPADAVWPDGTTAEFQFYENNSWTMSDNPKDIGTGAENTAMLMIRLHLSYRTNAADIANAYIHSGYDDWFLPSAFELQRMWSVLHANGWGGFITCYYWSSSEGSINLFSGICHAWSCEFWAGNLIEDMGTGQARVRPVRRF